MTMEDTQQCPKCSATCPLTARFCVKCGLALSGGAPATPHQRAHTQPLDQQALEAQHSMSSWAPSSAPPPGAVPSAAVAEPIAPVAAPPRVSAPPAPSARRVQDATSRPDAAANGASQPPARVTSAEIDKGFDDIEPHFEAISGSGDGIAGMPQDRQQVEVLFAHLAAEHLGPFRDFMVELTIGEARREWIRICSPAVNSLLEAAKKLGLSDLVGPLEVLSVELLQAQKGRGAMLEEEARTQLLNCHQELAKVLPEAFSVERESGRRDPIIVDSVLRQVPGVNKVQLDKIYAVGLTQLKMFYDAKAEDIAATTGLSLELCGLIVERFERYRRRAASIIPEPTRKAEYTQLEQLMSKLRRHNQAIDDQGRNWTRNVSKEKRKLRQARTDSWLEIQVVLARLGEAALLTRLERFPFGRKLEELEKFLERSKTDKREL
ncbi:MAG: hypothetical protein SFV15_08425 [Polyangiaceae bacterium]|nr:hypothetical protein [Polyangiaceae bacterium]